MEIDGLPRTVRVGPHVYNIHVVPSVVISGSDDCVGKTLSHKLAIAIDGEGAPSQVADTLLHEIVHAILRSSDLDHDVEERICLILGPGLLALLVDNPGLVSYLVGTAS